MTQLVLVRHGEAICNVERRIEGVATCRGLSDRGRAQAHALAGRLCGEGFKADVVVASPIKRARETAEILAAALEMPLTFDPDLEEVRPGEAEGLLWDQYFAFYGSSEGWDPSVAFAPGAEPWVQFAARVSAALDRIGTAHADKRVLLVAHGGVVDASMFHFFQLDPQVRSPIDFETTNTSITEWQRRTFAAPPESEADDVRRWRLVRYNDAGHLDTLA
jgi:2,3-bisphosphoglycerate-dependent phosphoglycerate mutase